MRGLKKKRLILCLEARLHSPRAPPPPPPSRNCKDNAPMMGFEKICKHNARMMGFKKESYALKKACTLQTQCSHDGFHKESYALKQACTATKAGELGGAPSLLSSFPSSLLPCSLAFLLPSLLPCSLAPFLPSFRPFLGSVHPAFLPPPFSLRQKNSGTTS